VEEFLKELQTELRAGGYRPKAVLRRYLPKADGRKRPLGIATVRDRVVQVAARIVLEPLLEASLLSAAGENTSVREMPRRRNRTKRNGGITTSCTPMGCIDCTGP
jgi:hypothetical protein